MKIPRQCQFFLLVEARLRKGKVLGSEVNKGLGSELRYDERKEVGQGPYCVESG
jgi:hypothetical protein